MPETTKLYHLAASPNCMKARIALRYKGIDYEPIAVNPNDRSEVIRISGQPLTPVLVHGNTVLFDSGAILRYLDANFRDTKPLFSADGRAMREIERWEAWGRSTAMAPVGIVFSQFFAETSDPAELRRASELAREAAGQIERQIGDGDWLVGDRMTAADVTAAPPLWYSMLEPRPEMDPIAAFFARHLQIGEGRDRTRAWVRKVMRHDH